MINNNFKRIYKEIKKYDTIVIARHIGPDPDALGSQFALREIIKNKYPHKNVFAVGASAPRFRFMGLLDSIDNIDPDNTLLIVVDTPDIKRIDGVNLNDYKNIIKIDHHPLVDKYANIELIDETASSTCQLIIEFILNNRIKVTEEIAKNIYIGIISDTSRFMHDYTSRKTFKLVNKLLSMTNFDFTSLYAPLYKRPLAEVRFQGYIYQNIEVTEEGLAHIKITEDILKEYNVDKASAGNIINDLKFIEEVIVWIFLTEDKKSNLIRANIRSRGPQINEIASIYGGGGHKYASGARLTSWSQADDLIKDLNELSKKYKEENK